MSDLKDVDIELLKKQVDNPDEPDNPDTPNYDDGYL